MPLFSYSIYNSNKLIDINSSLWEKPIPTTRYDNTNYKTTNNGSKIITYGNYFRVLSSLIKINKFELIITAINKQNNLFVCLHEINHIFICLKKHGAFYHPAHLEVRLNEKSFFFVINLAFSKEGRSSIRKEVLALNLLNFNKTLRYIPEVYSYLFDVFLFDQQVSLFIGEWFTDFHEFHLSHNKKKKENNILIWDTYNGNLYLHEKQTKIIFYQISMILSSYYDPVSTKHISSWHNASGDFIVCLKKDYLQVRLITVRDFKSMITNNNFHNVILSEKEILYSLMIFFLHLSLRVRLDRLDGVGNLVLLDEIYIPAIVKGFFHGLKLNVVSKKNNFPLDFTMFFKKYLLVFSEKTLLELTTKIVKKIYKNKEKEYSMFTTILDTHIHQIYQTLKKISL